MYYVYVLKSRQYKWFYTGSTNDLKRRIEEHNSGMVFASKPYIPLSLVYYEAGLNKNDALAREKYLKSGFGKKYLKHRLKNDLRSY